MFILASTGSAIGLGNVWRFPYMAGIYGGGTFILAYLFFILLFVIPGMVIEITAGAEGGPPFFKGFRKLVGKFWLFSILPFALCWIIFSYYMVITGWVLFYFVFSLFGNPPAFSDAAGGWVLPAFSFAALAMVSIVSALGVRKGIEKLNLYLMPLLFLSLIFLLANTAGLDGASESIAFITAVDLGGIANPQLLIAAFAQALFSLSVGMGILFTYGSYLRRKSGILGSVAAVAVLDTSFSLISAFIVFAITFTFALSPATGPTLVFETLPRALELVPLGNVLLPVFFLLLFFAAMTSAISLLEVLVSGVEGVGWSRPKTVLVVVAATALLFIPSLLSYSPVGLQFGGMPFLDYLNSVFVDRLMPVAMAVLVLLLAWKWKGAAAAFSSVFSPTPGRIFYAITKYLLPFTILLQMI
ncbi:sodium-dependent transporter [Candidatus Micrarchaeota archaeon]|nr:sodium-dependent transporter [Candidatus Micrarchaeota archaeon]